MVMLPLFLLVFLSSVAIAPVLCIDSSFGSISGHGQGHGQGRHNSIYIRRLSAIRGVGRRRRTSKNSHHRRGNEDENKCKYTSSDESVTRMAFLYGKKIQVQGTGIGDSDYIYGGGEEYEDGNGDIKGMAMSREAKDENNVVPYRSRSYLFSAEEEEFHLNSSLNQHQRSGRNTRRSISDASDGEKDENQDAPHSGVQMADSSSTLFENGISVPNYCQRRSRQRTSDDAVKLTASQANTVSEPQQQTNGVWPPWPFNLIHQQNEPNTSTPTHSSPTTRTRTSNKSNVNVNAAQSSGAAFFFTYIRERSKIGLRQMQQLGSALSFHLPPAAPPLMALGFLPSPETYMKEVMTGGGGEMAGTSAGAGAVAGAAPLVASISNMHGICRKLAQLSLVVSVLSWADYEVRKKNRLTPLPLGGYYKDGNFYGHIKRAISTLPPFLPEQLPPLELDSVLGNEKGRGRSTSRVGNENGVSTDIMTSGGNATLLPLPNTLSALQDDEGEDSDADLDNTNSDDEWNPQSGLQKGFKDVYNDIGMEMDDISMPQLPNMPNIPSFNNLISNWRKMRRLRQRTEAETKRATILTELLALQQRKKQLLQMQKRRQRGDTNNWTESFTEAARNAAKNALGKQGNGSHGSGNDMTNGNGNIDSRLQQQNAGIQVNAATPMMGYALVTGASRGIGRALAIELARWDIPLILIARDISKLKSLADEIETAYGVHCCVLPADLSHINAARDIHSTIAKAGLRVDILINNAGISCTNDVVDCDVEQVSNMINVNVGSVTNLSHLFAMDMKRERRGRILFMSSVVGATPGGPGVAAYSATKAYEKSLAMSMGRELEKYGVGVTCVMPGAVKGTSFASRSNAEDAICWKFPFYPMTAEDVASRSIQAVLSGDGEVIPGWHNRVFLKILSPLLPQRLTTSVVGFAFSPLRVGMPSPPWRVMKKKMDEDEQSGSSSAIATGFENVLGIGNISNSKKRPPRFLKLPTPNDKEAEFKKTFKIGNLGAKGQMPQKDADDQAEITSSESSVNGADSDSSESTTKDHTSTNTSPQVDSLTQQNT